MNETYEIAGKAYPILDYITTPQTGRVPLVDLPMMSDEEWIKSARENAVHNYTRIFGHPPESVEEAVEWQRKDTIEAIRRLEAAGS